MPRDTRKVRPLRSRRWAPRRRRSSPAVFVGALTRLWLRPCGPAWNPSYRPLRPIRPTSPAPYSHTFGDCETASQAACVVDGDIFWLEGVKVRIADIDTPELSPSRCDREKELGLKAKARLRELLSAGPFTLVQGSRDEDRYGRKLRIVRTEGGTSIGATLIQEGLARL
ncbi:thermonuclease family protein [Pleomorphomonas diazotrophica]